MIPAGMQRVYRRFERWRSRLGAACRRLALIERLPEGNQAEVLEAIRREALSSAELGGMVHLWLGCAERRQPEYLLAHPRAALSQAKGVVPAVRDPRSSEAGNQVWKRVGLLLDVLGRMDVWLAHQGRTGLTPADRDLVVQFPKAGAGCRIGGGAEPGFRRRTGARIMRDFTRNEMIRLHYGGASQRRIAKLLGVARRSVAGVLADHEQHRAGVVEVERTRRPRLLDPFADHIEQLRERYPNLRAVRLHEELCRLGFKGNTVHLSTLM